MLRLALAAGACLLAARGLAGPITVYKWVDSKGVIHYSDQPHPNAQKLSIVGAQSYAPPPPLPAVAASPPSESSSSRQTCSIAQPANQQMLMNVYKTTAVVQASPPLQPDDRVQLFLDGKQLPAGDSSAGTSFTFPVHRGQHSLEAVIENAVGQIICETSSITFYVHQPSMLRPNNPVHGRPPL